MFCVQLASPQREAGDVSCLLPRLEYQGCHLNPFPIYLCSCFFCLDCLLFLSCHFSANGPLHSPDLFPENCKTFFVNSWLKGAHNIILKSFFFFCHCHYVLLRNFFLLCRLLWKWHLNIFWNNS